MAKVRSSLSIFALAMVSPFCHYGKCPSYPGKKDPRVYCEKGKKRVYHRKEGLYLPPGAPSGKKDHLKKQYYCLTGMDAKSML
jgi:hypothetical protein